MSNISRNGARLLSQCVHFRICSSSLKTVGLESAGRGAGGHARRPDLRHSFAVSTLLTGIATDAPIVEARLPLLSTYLGHVDPADTYGYLTPPRSCCDLPPASSKGSREVGHDTARPDAAGVLHRASPRASARSAHARSPPTATRSAAAALRPTADRQTAVPTRLRRPRRATDRRVPRRTSNNERGNSPDPQRPARGDPLAVPLRRSAPPRARRKRSPA